MEKKKTSKDARKIQKRAQKITKRLDQVDKDLKTGFELAEGLKREAQNLKKDEDI